MSNNKKKKKGRKGKFWFVLGTLFLLGALGLTSYNMYDSHRAKVASQTLLSLVADKIAEKDPIPPEGRPAGGSASDSADVSGIVAGSNAAVSNLEMEYPDYMVNPKMDMPSIEINGRWYVGLLSLPTIDRELPVLQEWNYDSLTVAPCRYKGTAYMNDLIICAHNYFSHFGTIRNLRIGDPVIYTDVDGNVFHYVVMELENLQPTEVDRMLSGEWDLTFFTCTLSGYSRVTVRCQRVGVDPAQAEK